ncbi:unnamed protein product [Peronospora belbahrii]|uniref:U4/U6.U5 small nuclear ribonucleoprotein 27kDa protein domain-containing protein n=1 Tax=Peronospora belbahrii TaxID=622444 RepID=A0ABN8CUA2_9STRA|nr:unnamed protein product [Peronospora belbahrii]
MHVTKALKPGHEVTLHTTCKKVLWMKQKLTNTLRFTISTWFQYNLKGVVNNIMISMTTTPFLQITTNVNTISKWISRQFRPSSSPPSDTERAEEPKIEPNDKPNAMSQLCEEEQMKLLLGFEDFDSTKGKNVEENVKGPAVGTVRRDTKREYRQYMNRRGGFNRPLDKVTSSDVITVHVCFFISYLAATTT